MVKKIFLSIILFLFVSGTIVGEDKLSAMDNGTLEEKTFGSYIIPNEWILVEPWSTNAKFFYANEQSKYSKSPTNISVEQRTSSYSKDEHETFRYAIMTQLSSQLQNTNNREDTTIGGSGSFTINNDILYTFSFRDNFDGEECNVTQLYIIGEKEFILIHITEFDNDFRDAEKIAQNIADTFTWSQN